MSVKTKLIAVTVVLLLIGAALLGGFIWGRSRAISAMKPEVVTRIIHDTTRVELPIIRTEYKYIDRYIEVPVWDTLRVEHHDTVAVVVPYTVREYKDTTYFAKVGGYKPELLEIETYNRTVYNTQLVPEQKPWGLGVQVGGGAVYADGKVTLAPYIGVGISYNIIRW